MTRQEMHTEIEEAFGFIPDWLNGMPDAVLDQYWPNHVWVCSDSELSGKEKALIAFGAAAALHCEYRTSFHTAQLRLAGMDDEQMKEAGWVVQNVMGASGYFYGIGYDKKKFDQELERLVEFRKNSHSVSTAESMK
jgi:AhpD family alkylhydroperoxidase